MTDILPTGQMLDYLYSTIGGQAVKEAMAVRRGIHNGVYWHSAAVVAQLYEEHHGMSEEKAKLYRTAIVRMDPETVEHHKELAGSVVSVLWVGYEGTGGKLHHLFDCTTVAGVRVRLSDRHLERFYL